MLSCLYGGKLIHAENTLVHSDDYKCITCNKPVILKIFRQSYSCFVHKANEDCIHEDPILRAISLLERSSAKDIAERKDRGFSPDYSCIAVDKYMYEFANGVDRSFKNHCMDDINQENIRRLISIAFRLLKNEIRLAKRQSRLR